MSFNIQGCVCQHSNQCFTNASPGYPFPSLNGPGAAYKAILLLLCLHDQGWQHHRIPKIIFDGKFGQINFRYKINSIVGFTFWILELLGTWICQKTGLLQLPDQMFDRENLCFSHKTSRPLCQSYLMLMVGKTATITKKF